MVGADKITTGHWLFAACCLAYLIWWAIAFRPGFKAPMAIKSILFLITAGLGIAGLIFIVSGCNAFADTSDTLFTSCMIITGAGIVIYLILLYLTGHFMHRQVTTELLLIVFWICMEICTVVSLYEGDVFTMTAAVIFAAIVIVAAVAGMISYLAYYNMEPMKAYYDGMIPLILFGAVMAGMAGYIMKIA